MWTKVHKLQKSKTAKYGVPMLLMIVGSSFGLREFTQIRYDAQKIQRKMDPALEAKLKPKKQSDILEEEYEVMRETSVAHGHGRTRRSPRSGSSVHASARALRGEAPRGRASVHRGRAFYLHV
uniref:Cytochrome c oxidase assembly protein COX16 homolog, mitochondrial n=1 Tax=Electrophorus electricus TaxID=8005 RepID=A0A4W4DP86_ELEEL